MKKLGTFFGRTFEKIHGLTKATKLQAKLPGPTHSAYPWAYGHIFGDSQEETDEKRQAWIEKISNQTNTLKKWLNQLSETRVDVNEAVDAMDALLRLDLVEEKSTLYECLFVGRHFSRHILAQIRFERCAFARCTFELPEGKELAIKDCQVTSCEFFVKNSQINFISTKLWGVKFSSVQDSQLTFSRCEGYEVTIDGTPQLLNLDQDVFYKLKVLGGELVDTSPMLDILFRRSILVNAQLEKLRLSAKSNITPTCFSDVKMNNVDLANVVEFDDVDIEMITANATTIAPASMDRPTSWPAYDPKGDPDDIPF